MPPEIAVPLQTFLFVMLVWISLNVRRQYSAFAILTALLALKLMLRSLWWTKHWLWFESAVLIAWWMTIWEAGYCATFLINRSRARSIAKFLLFGGMASVLLLGDWTSKGPDAGLFIAFRDASYITSAVVLFAGAAYAIAWPFTMPIFPRIHWLLLLCLSLAHALSRPLGHYKFAGTEELYLPTCVLIFLVWAAAVARSTPSTSRISQSDLRRYHA